MEQKRENDYNEMSKIMLSGVQKEGEMLFSNINVTHHGIKCNKCGANPIIGHRYKCSLCKNYNLCQICEEKNFETQEHKHNFIKMRTEEKKNEVKKNKNKDIENKNKDKYKIEKIEKEKNKGKEVKLEYQYEILDFEKLTKPKEVEEEDETVSFKLTIKNNANLQWIEKKTKLIVDHNSQIKTKNNKRIVLNPLNANETQEIEIELDLKNIEPGEYICLLNFNVDDKNYGAQLILTVKVKEGKITELRKLFDLSKEDYSKQKLSKVLKEKNFQMNEAFDALF